MIRGIALTIGGSDSGGCAGIQADLKTFMALKIHGCTAITCVTAQNTYGVNRVDPLPSTSLKEQIITVLNDFDIGALKTGMLLNKSLIETTSECLNSINIPKLIDPVMVSRAGSTLIEKDAVEAYKKLLIPQAELITPNIYEGSLISGLEITNKKEMEKAAEKIINHGVSAVLIKGGGIKNLRGKDYFLTSKNNGQWFVNNTINTQNTNGSGCTLIAAITAFRSSNYNLSDSIKKAKNYVEQGLINSLDIGKGQGPLCHWKNRP